MLFSRSGTRCGHSGPDSLRHQPGPSLAVQNRARTSRRGAGPLAATATAPSDKGFRHQSADGIEVSIAEPELYWPAADLHCCVFYDEMHLEQQGQQRQMPEGFGAYVQGAQHVFQRWDRVVALQINDNLQDTGLGRTALLVAFDGEDPTHVPPDPHPLDHPPGASSTNSSSSNSWQGHPLLGLARSSLHENVRPGVGRTAGAARILAVANLDTFGDLVPPRNLDAQRDGALGWYKREGIAYVSNVAVVPSARRRGLASALMGAAESLAAQWGSRAIGLHCNPRNSAAIGLYGRLGYRPTPALEAPWVPYLMGRAPDRCQFFLKRLPSGTLQQQREHPVQASALQQQQQP